MLRVVLYRSFCFSLAVVLFYTASAAGVHAVAAEVGGAVAKIARGPTPEFTDRPVPVKVPEGGFKRDPNGLMGAGRGLAFGIGDDGSYDHEPGYKVSKVLGMIGGAAIVAAVIIWAGPAVMGAGGAVLTALGVRGSAHWHMWNRNYPKWNGFTTPNPATTTLRAGTTFDRIGGSGKYVAPQGTSRFRMSLPPKQWLADRTSFVVNQDIENVVVGRIAAYRNWLGIRGGQQYVLPRNTGALWRDGIIEIL